jgi:hypothetical protein
VEVLQAERDSVTLAPLANFRNAALISLMLMATA